MQRQRFVTERFAPRSTSCRDALHPAVRPAATTFDSKIKEQLKRIASDITVFEPQNVPIDSAHGCIDLHMNDVNKFQADNIKHGKIFELIVDIRAKTIFIIFSKQFGSDSGSREN